MNRSTIQTIVLAILWAVAITLYVQAVRADEIPPGVTIPPMTGIFPFPLTRPLDNETTTPPNGWHCEHVSGLGLVCSRSADENTAQEPQETDDITKAKKICDAHAVIDPEENATEDFVRGWGACYKIQNVWKKREFSKKLDAEILSEQKDKDFVNGIADKQEDK